MSTDPETLKWRQAVDEKLDAIMRRLDQMDGPKRPGLTVTEFARKVGVHPNTIFRKIANREILKRNRKIPASELDKFVS